MTCDPHWTNYLSALLTPIVAVLGSVIAYRQWRTAQNKLKFELFDRRFSIYEESKNLILSIVSSGKAKEESIYKFFLAARSAKWLLNKELATYLDTVYDKGIDLLTLQSELEGIPAGDERSENVRKQTEIKKWLHAQLEVLDEKFSPFLKLQH